MEDRMVRLTPDSSDMGSVIISKDGETLYYFAAFEDGYDLWKMDLPRKKDTRCFTKWMPVGLLWKWTKRQNLFLLGGKPCRKMDVASDELKPVNYQAQAKMDLAAEREYMFDHVYKQQKKRFYNTDMHGVGWDSMSAAYRKFLPHIRQ